MTYALTQATITWPMVEMFLRLCPLCKLRAKGQPTRVTASATGDEDSSTPGSSRATKR